MATLTNDLDGRYDLDGVSQAKNNDVVIASAKIGNADVLNIGITFEGRQKIVGGLSHVLADTYTLYLMTHNFHWNVTGPQFRSLHMMFEEQYLELADAVDLIAERIRALGLPTPATYGEFQLLTSLKESIGVPHAMDMVRMLCDAQESVIRTARTTIPVAEIYHDYPTVDLLTQRMQSHEKTAWMLRSLQGN